MANDRIWIRCKLCGNGIPITKYYPSMTLGELNVSAARLHEWLEIHLRERDSSLGGPDLEGNPGLEFCTDDPDTATGQLFCGKDKKPVWPEASTHGSFVFPEGLNAQRTKDP
jgi:hypothetical protein